MKPSRIEREVFRIEALEIPRREASKMYQEGIFIWWHDCVIEAVNHDPYKRFASNEAAIAHFHARVTRACD